MSVVADFLGDKKVNAGELKALEDAVNEFVGPEAVRDVCRTVKRDDGSIMTDFDLVCKAPEGGEGDYVVEVFGPYKRPSVFKPQLERICGAVELERSRGVPLSGVVYIFYRGRDTHVRLQGEINRLRENGYAINLIESHAFD